LEIKIPTPQLIEISKLKPYPFNVKKHPESQITNLMKLMQWVGFKDPIVIDKDGEIKAGHGRLEAAKRLGMEKVPFIPLEGLTKKQMKLFIYMDNKINESPWDKENVKLLFEDIPKKDIDFFELSDDKYAQPNTSPDEKPIPTPPQNPISKLGDIFQLGNHRIMCGDSTNQENINKLLGNNKPKAVITDPPYGLGGYAGRSGAFNAIIGDDDKDIEKFYAVVDKSIPEIYMWCSWKYFQKSKHVPRDVIVWKKNNFGMGRGYRGQYEICLYYGSFAGSDSDVWEIAKDDVNSYQHPTQKPVGLAIRAIMNSTVKDDIVLDYYLGSGSTLIGCEQTNRTCYGIEIDPAYIDVIITRWENFTGKKAKKV